MNSLSQSGKVIADDFRRVERSINLAMKDAAQLLLNTLDATDIHGVSPSMSLRTVKATIGALEALAESQQQICVRAHLSAEKVGLKLGLSETSWGENLPKPAMDDREELDKEQSKIPAYDK
jgi:hypothetical protein